MKTEKEIVEELCNTLNIAIQEATPDYDLEHWPILDVYIQRLKCLLWVLEESEEE